MVVCRVSRAKIRSIPSPPVHVMSDLDHGFSESDEGGEGPFDPGPPPEPGPQPVGEDGQFTQRIQHQAVSARVPEAVASGVFASAALVLNGPHEFIIDFLQSVSRPSLVAQRIVLPLSVVPSVVDAIRRNLDAYRQRFGSPPELPRPPRDAQPPSVQEIYEQLKLPDDAMGGTYANTVMITHGPSEFCFDFIASFYPRAQVGARVYMAAPQVPRLLDTLSRSYQQYQEKINPDDWDRSLAPELDFDDLPPPHDPLEPPPLDEEGPIV